MTKTNAQKVAEAKLAQPVTTVFTQIFAALLVGVAAVEGQVTKLVDEAIKEIESFLKDTDAQV